jgi:thymidine kinase
MINSCADIINHINNNLTGTTIKEIYVDECQFLPDIYKWVMDIKENKTLAESKLRAIILAGLDLDAKGNYFTEAFKNVIDIADVNYALQAFCYVCGANASYTKLLDTATKMEGNVLIGGAELYQPVCGVHFCSKDSSN